MIPVSTMTPGLTEQQQAMRRRGIGASEIAAIAGLSRWKSPMEVWEAKVHGHPLETSYAAALGLALEEPVAQAWAAETGLHVAPVATLQHPEHPLALATPDRAVSTSPLPAGPLGLEELRVRRVSRLLQVKSTTWRAAADWGEEGTDRIPVDYLCQAHWEGSVAGAARVTFAVDWDKARLASYEVQVDAGVFHRLLELAERWWRDYVVPQRAPPPDGTRSYSDVLARLHPRDTLPVVEALPPEVRAVVEELVYLRQGQRALKRREQVVAQAVRLALGDSAGAVGPWGRVTLRARKDTVRTDWEAAARELEGLALLAVQALPRDQRGDLVETVRGVVERHSETVPGVRPLVARLTGEDWQTLRRHVDAALLEADDDGGTNDAD